jgi:hypothetical protein
MCTKEEVKDVVYEAFNEENGLRHEIQEDIKKELKLAVFQVLAAFGVTILAAIVSGTVYLTGLRSDVDTLNEADYFTHTEARILEERIGNNTDAINGVAKKEDLQRVEETLIRLDERLRNQGI